MKDEEYGHPETAPRTAKGMDGTRLHRFQVQGVIYAPSMDIAQRRLEAAHLFLDRAAIVPERIEAELERDEPEQPPVRRAVVHHSGRSMIAAYLPENYKIIGTCDGGTHLLIEGRDRAGWTLDDYVIPRLASGLIHAEELKDHQGDDSQ